MEDKEVHTFPKGICLKVNVIAWLEFKLTYDDSAVQWFNHYTTRTPPLIFEYIYQSIWVLVTMLLSVRIFRLLTSSLLLYSQRFGWYMLRPSSGVSCWTREPTQNHCEYKTKDEIDRLNIQRDNNYQASSQNFSEIITILSAKNLSMNFASPFWEVGWLELWLIIQCLSD